jgi:hypothetical protein
VALGIIAFVTRNKAEDDMKRGYTALICGVLVNVLAGAAHAAVAKPEVIDTAAAFTAAGFKAKGKEWTGCDGDSTAAICAT